MDNLEEHNSCAWWGSQSTLINPSVAQVSKVHQVSVWNVSITRENITFVFEVQRIEELVNNSFLFIAHFVISLTIKDEAEG